MRKLMTLFYGNYYESLGQKIELDPFIITEKPIGT